MAVSRSRLSSFVVLGATAIAVLAGCGGSADRASTACSDGRDALAAIGPIVRAADARPALRAVIALERQARDTVGDGPLVPRLNGAIAAVERVLERVDADPLPSPTMSPLRTVVPDARRAVATARQLVADLCRN